MSRGKLTDVVMGVVAILLSIIVCIGLMQINAMIGLFLAVVGICIGLVLVLRKAATARD